MKKIKIIMLIFLILIIVGVLTFSCINNNCLRDDNSNHPVIKSDEEAKNNIENVSNSLSEIESNLDKLDSLIG